MSAQAEAFNTVAIFGASGSLGKSITQGFLTDPKYRFQVSLVIRPTQSAENRKLLDNFVALGAKIVQADLADENTLAAALVGVDIAVSAYGLDAISANLELPLITAARKANVKRFILSDFGVIAETKNHFPWQIKDKSLKLAQEIGLPWTSIHTSVWNEFLVTPAIGGIDLVNHKATVLGDGTFSFSTISLTDVGRFAVRVALHPAAKNKEVGVATEHWTWNSFLAAIDKASGSSLQKGSKSLAEVNEDAKLTGFPQMVAVIQQTYLTFKKGVDFYDSAFNRAHAAFFADLPAAATIEGFVKASSKAK